MLSEAALPAACRSCPFPFSPRNQTLSKANTLAAQREKIERGLNSIRCFLNGSTDLIGFPRAKRLKFVHFCCQKYHRNILKFNIKLICYI